jgi:hypothetical protein
MITGGVAKAIAVIPIRISNIPNDDGGPLSQIWGVIQAAKRKRP